MNADQALLHRWRDGDHDVDAGTNPLARRVRMRIATLDRTAGRIRLDFAPETSMRDAAGCLTTTAVAAMLDFACGYVAIAVLVPAHTVVSSTLRIEWIGASAAAAFEASGSIEGRSATTLFTRATLRDVGGEPIALASSTLRIVATRHPQT